jgi:REP element-mobilizing transposase RayT
MKKIPPHAGNLRKGRFSSPNQVYVITVVTRNRQPLFLDFPTARRLINILQRHEEMKFAQTLAFVIMPDHFHWLMQLEEKHDISQTVRAVKSIFSRAIGRPVFQKGFYDHAVRHDEDLRTMARYIVANPLRAGLVENINDYPHWDAVWME